jgi:hypothetical protein
MPSHGTAAQAGLKEVIEVAAQIVGTRKTLTITDEGMKAF